MVIVKVIQNSFIVYGLAASEDGGYLAVPYFFQAQPQTYLFATQEMLAMQSPQIQIRSAAMLTETPANVNPTKTPVVLPTKTLKRPGLLQIQEDSDGHYSESSEFRPNRPVCRKKQRRTKQRENQCRNVMPNLVHQIFSYLFKPKKSLFVVRKAFAREPPSPEISIQRFYLYQSHVKQAMDHYVNQSSLRIFTQLADPEFSIFTRNQQQFYLKVSRAITRHFLRWVSPSMTLTSLRMSKDKKFQHLKGRRLLLDRLDHLHQQ